MPKYRNVLYGFFIFLQTCTWAFTSSSSDMNQLRKLFFDTSYDISLLPSLEKKLNQFSDKNATILAYKGATRALYARKEWNPFEQLSIVKEAVNVLNKAESSDPNNVEIRFLRFATQHYIPSFLGMSGNLEKDKVFVLSHLEQMKELSIDYGFVTELMVFIEKSGRFSKHDLNQMKSVLNSTYNLAKR